MSGTAALAAVAPSGIHQTRRDALAEQGGVMSERACKPCTCPHGERPLGMLHGVNMGRGTVRLSTTPGCPEHTSCHGWTKERRAERPEWSTPYCPVHRTANCPAGGCPVDHEAEAQAADDSYAMLYGEATT